MGRFSKALVENVVGEWEDSYFYYKFIKKRIRKVQKEKTEDPGPALYAILLNQMKMTISKFRALMQEFRVLFASKIHSEKSAEVYEITAMLKKLVSFSLWNLKILNRSLTRYESLIPGSRSKFLISNLDLLNELRNLQEFSECEKLIDLRCQSWKPALEGLCEPLLPKSQMKELVHLNRLDSSLKSELKSLESLEIFPKDPDYPDFITLLLMVISSFLQQTNFYILALAAKDYSTHLEVPETYSGLLNFATWISVIICSFVYNYWAFFQYKIPTLFCSCCMVTGNLLYFISYSSGKFGIAIFGRVLIGMGGSRIINRRYISRFVNKSVQSNWKNFYIAGSIVGRGMGPILASSLYYIDYPTSSINGVNAPALLMCLLWTFYTLMVIISFEEPVIPLSSPWVRKNPKPEVSVFAVILVISTFMIPKMVHEAQVTSIPIVASYEFNWSVDFIGVFIAAMSLAVGPVYIFIGFTDDIFEDRQFTRIAMVLTFIGSGMLISYEDMYEAQYIIGTFILYLGVNMDDGITGSLLSILFNSGDTNDYINPGFLITVFGSLARGLGALSIAICGEIEDDPDDMQTLLFGPLALLVGFGLLSVVVFYSKLGTRKRVG